MIGQVNKKFVNLDSAMKEMESMINDHGYVYGFREGLKVAYQLITGEEYVETENSIYSEHMHSSPVEPIPVTPIEYVEPTGLSSTTLSIAVSEIEYVTLDRYLALGRQSGNTVHRLTGNGSNE